jgi:FkbM family methyltransferase
VLVRHADAPSPIGKQIDALLSESISDCVERERTTFDALGGGDASPIVLLGAGQLGRRTLSALASVGHPVVAVADNNSALWGTAIGDVPVLSPSRAAREYGTKAIFVVSIWRAGGSHRYENSRRQLAELGVNRISPIAPLMWKYDAAMLPHYCLDLPHRVLEESTEIQRAFRLMSDGPSQIEFVSQLRFRLLADFDGLAHPDSDPQYLAAGLFTANPDERFVDCGAYNGDTLRSVIDSSRPFASYIALEPDATNFSALQSYVHSLPHHLSRCIRPLRQAAHSVRRVMRIEGNGASAVLVPASGASRTDDVECVPLDETLGNAPHSFLKMDIEGAEPDALIGASAVIARDRPIIAVCVYHLQNHLWRIPLLVDSFVKDYAYYLRPYNEEGWDLVCYAVPRERILA